MICVNIIIYICAHVHTYTETIKDGGYWSEKLCPVTGRCRYSSIVYSKSMQNVRRHLYHKAL